MSLDNPYDFSDPSTSASTPGGGLPHGIIEELRMTRPWVRLMGILGMIGCVLMVIFAAFAFLSGLGFAGGGAAILGLVYLVFAFLYGYPCLKLINYGSAISEFEREGSLAGLERALMQQRMFWRFVGILTAAILLLYLIGIVGALLIGGFMAM